MRLIVSAFRLICIGLSAALVVLFIPGLSSVAIAQESPDAIPADTTTTQSVDPTPEPAPAVAPVVDVSTETTAPVTVQAQQPAPPTNNQGPTSPTGDASSSYHYNAETGLWENDYYTWDASTQQTQPKTAPTYSYNPATGHWDTVQYVYDAPSGKYVPNVVSIASPCGCGVDSASISGIGPGSTNAITAGNSGNGSYDLFYNASISNSLGGLAVSGNASILSNTLGGSALTGGAASVATVLNLLQSTTNLLGGNLATFTQNVSGNVQGDLLIDPSQFSKVQQVHSPSTNLTVNAQADGLIDNDIGLTANSGDALVQNNTTAGNATSGNADAVANLVNIINSAITGQHSFLGILNIFGNLDGDILLPQNMLDTLLAASGPSATSNSTITGDQKISADVNNTQYINNSIATTAATGQASVTGNTRAGDATSGDAMTNVTLLNLTGRNVVGKDALLVFVNVLGHWVGLIMDAPTGTSSAAVGGGISAFTDLPAAQTANVNLSNDSKINNNVVLNAASGDATVTHNTTGGNATTGNATASANIANIENSALSLSGWFGILFINVFGTWNGSFGVNTAAGNPPPVGGSGGSGGGTASNPGSPAPQVFAFVPHGSGGTSSSSVTPGLVEDSNENQADQKQGAVVLGQNNNTGSPTQMASGFGNALLSANSSWIIPAAGILIGGSMLGAERIISSRKNRRLAQSVNATTTVVSA